VLLDYMHISLIKPGALEILRNYGVQSCLIERDEVLGVLLAASGDWEKVYSDNVSTLFVRKSGHNAGPATR